MLHPLLGIRETRIGKFKPVAYGHTGMDMIIATTKDCSSRNKWIDHIHLELDLDPYKNKMVGFTLVSLKGLLKKGETSSILRIIMRAMVSDWQNRKNWIHISQKEFLVIYAKAVILLLMHPTMRHFKKEAD